MKYYEVSYYLSHSCGTPNRSRVVRWLLNDEWSNVEKTKQKNYKSTFFLRFSNKHHCSETNVNSEHRLERTR